MILKSQLPLEDITVTEFERIVDAGELVVADSHGPNVLHLDNGNMIKLFRRKRLISSALFSPYAVRFTNNAFKLSALDIPTVTPVRLMHCATRSIHLVEYRPLTGELLRGLLQAEGSDDQFSQTARFIAELHHKGVYFRSLHFENIITHDGSLGLIDIADMKIYRHPLSQSLRQRNFQHFMRYPQDAALISSFGEERFRQHYLEQQMDLESTAIND